MLLITPYISEYLGLFAILDDYLKKFWIIILNKNSWRYILFFIFFCQSLI